LSWPFLGRKGVLNSGHRVARAESWPEMVRYCGWVIAPGVRCNKKALLRHNLPLAGQTWLTATGPKDWGCNDHHFRFPRWTEGRGEHHFRDNQAHTDLYFESLKHQSPVDCSVLPAQGQQVLPLSQPAWTLCCGRLRGCLRLPCLHRPLTIWVVAPCS